MAPRRPTRADQHRSRSPDAPGPALFVGLDWGAYAHAVCVIDPAGTVLARFEPEHSAAGLADALARLAKLAPAADLPVAVERPTGLLIDTLVGAGHPVVPIHPNVVKASRPRYSAAGAKSDPGDAFLLADLLRTDGHRFAPLTPASDAVRALRARVRTRDDLVAERIALSNQLRALLDRFWPGAARAFADLASPIALAFVRRYPTPKRAARLNVAHVQSFLDHQRYSGRRSAAEVLERVRAAPVGQVGDAEARASGELAVALVDVLSVLVERLARLTRDIEREVGEIATGRLLMSLPRAGKLNAAQILAELGEDPARFGSEQRLAAEAGVAPVTFASGRSRGVAFRYACNKRLRRALTGWANNSRFSSDWAAGVYARARARGKSHPHAVRILARAWVKVLWRCWQSAEPYDPTRHGAAAELLAPT